MEGRGSSVEVRWKGGGRLVGGRWRGGGGRAAEGRGRFERGEDDLGVPCGRVRVGGGGLRRECHLGVIRASSGRHQGVIKAPGFTWATVAKSSA